MKLLSILLLALVNITGCADLVKGDDMLRVLETGADAGVGYPIAGNGKANVGSCRMEHTGELPPGTKFEYNGIKCHVTVEPDGP